MIAYTVLAHNATSAVKMNSVAITSHVCVSA